MMKIGKAERCNHKPVCVCEGLGGYMRITEVITKQVGQVEPNVDENGFRWTRTGMLSIFEDVFSYSWLKAVRM